MSCLYLSHMRFQLWFITMYPRIQTNNIRTTYCKSRHSSKPLQLYATGFSLHWMFKLAVTQFISTCSWLYNCQDVPRLFGIIFLTFPQQQVITTETHQPGVIQSKSSQMTGASHNAPPGEIQQQSRNQLVHSDPAVVATNSMTQDIQFKTINKTRISKKYNQHAIGYE